ncbi:MAG: DUF4856 domain-containing protein [Flavobacteriaceae bacterium]|nr:DUF4856 domain-containing protein [Flavobacteriaceae bacterium]
MKNYLFTALLASFALFSCANDDEGSSIDNSSVEAPATYVFERDGQSTVSFEGQTTRILMAGEIAGAFNDFDASTEASVKAMFAHQEGENNFSDSRLNASGKNVRSKTAASKDYFGSNATEAATIKNTFDGYIDNHFAEVVPNRNVAAAPGVSGQIADGSSPRYVAANGLEMNQIFAKGLIGALMADQMLNNYLSTSVLDEANNRTDNDNEITVADKPYTTMEHKWDEAYGYLFGAAQNTANPVPAIGEADGFLNKYVGKVNSDLDFEGIAQEIFDAFKLGRAAIVAKNYEVRDQQADLIRQLVSEVIAIRAVYYLQAGKVGIQDGDFGAAFHDLSEGYGFVYSLRFTRNTADDMPYFSKGEVDSFLSELLSDGSNGLWNVTPETLDRISEAIAAKFDFTVQMAAN